MLLGRDARALLLAVRMNQCLRGDTKPTTRRNFIKSIPAQGHFHPTGKVPFEHTLRVLAEARDGLPFNDTRDFDERARGLIAEMPEPQI